MNVHIDNVNIYEASDPALASKLGEILNSLAELRGIVMTNQEQLDELTKAIGEAADSLGTSLTGLSSDVGALEAAVKAGTELDFTAAKAKIDALKSVVAGLATLDAANPKPEPAPAP